MNAPAQQWWLACLGETLIWARLEVLDSGLAEVFDSDGCTLYYDDESAARMALLDVEFCAFDGIDEDDAATDVAAFSSKNAISYPLLRDPGRRADAARRTRQRGPGTRGELSR